MKYRALTVSLTYVPAEDRIRWTSKCEGGEVVVAWVTRRHLQILLPRLAEWLDRKSPLQQKIAVPAVAKREIRNIEHQAAQQQVKSVRGYARKPKTDVEFLLNYFGVNVIDEVSVELTLLSSVNGMRLSLPGTFAQLHKLVREMLDMGNTAGWAVPDPWRELPPAGSAADPATRH